MHLERKTKSGETDTVYSLGKIMNVLTRPTMAKVGRPRKEESEPDTKMVRLFTDMVEKLGDLALVLPQTIAQIVDPLIRPEVDFLWEKYRPLIEKAKAAQKAADEALEWARMEAEQLDIKPGKPGPRKKPGS